jgi:putative hydrolase of the HAD superfamily
MSMVTPKARLFRLGMNSQLTDVYWLIEQDKHMSANQVKNVVFDIGNVLVRWSPAEIVRLTFGESENVPTLTRSIFQSKLWLELNQGKFTEEEAKKAYQHQFDFSATEMERLFYYVKHTQILLFGSLALLQRVREAGYRTYALTDNVIEIVEYLQAQYNFWSLFHGAIVSAKVHCTKPGAEIFGHLVSRYHIEPGESVFIDDVLRNIEGAKAVGFSAIHFHHAEQCEQELKELGLVF